MKKMIYAFCVLALVASCKQKEKAVSDYRKIFADPDTYCKTVYELNSVVMGNNFTPVVASRNYLYANVAAYEVMAAGYPDKLYSLAGQLNGLQALPKPDKNKSIDYEFSSLLAFWRIGRSVTFSANKTKDYVDSLKRLAQDHGMAEDVFNNSVEYADTVSGAIMAWSKKDNYLVVKGMPEYEVRPDVAGRWIPTPPAYSGGMEPNWNKIRTVVMDSATQFVPPAPHQFDMNNKKSEYYKELMASKKAVDSLTPEQKHIAEFWDNNPFKMNVSGHLMFGSKKFSPPGHWMSIVGIASQQSKADYVTTVYAYTITAISLFDAFIQCWDQKYRSNTARPNSNKSIHRRKMAPAS